MPNYAGSFVQLSAPYFVSAGRRAEIGQMVQRLPAYARQLDQLRATYTRLKPRMTPQEIDTVETKFYDAERNFETANRLTGEAYARCQAANGFPPGSTAAGVRGLAGWEEGAIAIGAVAAIALVIFFGAALSPFIAAIIVVVAALALLAAALSQVSQRVGETVQELGPVATTTLGMGTLALAAAALFLFFGGRRE